MARTPESFIKEVEGHKYDVDGSYGVQCVDGFKKFLKWAGIPLWKNTTGNSRASGYWIYRNSNGLSKYFNFITGSNNFRNGDWVVWGSGSSHPYTHIAMYYNGKEFGQNQHSKKVGAGFCFINGRFGDALGAFRLKEWETLSSVDAVSGAASTKSSSKSVNYVDPAKMFVREALKHVGSGGHAWVQSMTSIGNGAWCAATCCAVAKACGFADIIMPSNEYSASNFGKKVVQNYGGTYLPGEVMKGNSKPQVGDLVLYTNRDGTGSYNSGTKWAAKHIEIVAEVYSDSIKTVAGNTSGTYMTVNRSLKGGKMAIGWFARPDWSRVNGVSGAGGQTEYYYEPLYDTVSTKADAAIREVCYLTFQGQPSIEATVLKLSVINYTSLLSNIVDEIVGTSSGVYSNDNIDGLPPVPREIVQYLVGKGLSTAAAIGIVANIEFESNFKTNCVGDKGTSFGICQWHNERGTAMKKMAGSNWSSNLTGQLDYLWYELTYSYALVLSSLKKVQNTVDGAKEAADIFVRKFEIPKNVDSQSKKRQAAAEKYWKLVVVGSNASSTSSSVSSSTIAAQSGSSITNGYPMTQGKSVSVPASVPQTGIVANYTSYTKFYSRWAKGTTQRKLADIWASKGKKYSHQVATIDGYYLIALSPIFGKAGDKVSVILQDGSFFNAIIADEKGPDAKSTYGHYLGSKVDVVEWEAYGESQSALKKGLQNAGWYGKKVDRIINFGKYA